MSRKPVILVFADWFVPGYKAGGPISSCLNFAFLMKDDYDVYVFTSDTDHGETEPYENIPPDTWISNIDPGFKVYYARRKNIHFGQVKKVIEDIRPDYIYLNNLYSLYYVLYPLWLKWKGAIPAKIILCPRGALYESALAVKPMKKKFFIKAFKALGMPKKFVFQATNEREKAAIRHIFPGSEIVIAEDLPSMQQPAWLSCTKEKGIARCIFIARIVDIKNLLFLLEALAGVKAGIELTIAGPVEDAEYWKLCEQKIKELPANIKTDYIGPVPNRELVQLTRGHHLYILPTQGESFGHTIFEALSTGRPVLISDQTPWLGLAGRQVGWDIPLNNPAGFTAAIEQVAAWDQPVFDKWAKSAHEFAHQFIESSSFREQYKSLFS